GRLRRGGPGRRGPRGGSGGGTGGHRNRRRGPPSGGAGRGPGGGSAWCGLTAVGGGVRASTREGLVRGDADDLPRGVLERPLVHAPWLPGGARGRVGPAAAACVGPGGRDPDRPAGRDAP